MEDSEGVEACVEGAASRGGGAGRQRGGTEEVLTWEPPGYGKAGLWGMQEPRGPQAGAWGLRGRYEGRRRPLWPPPFHTYLELLPEGEGSEMIPQERAGLKSLAKVRYHYYFFSFTAMFFLLLIF